MDNIPNTYFEFTLGYALLWLVFFGTLVVALLQIAKLNQKVKDLESGQPRAATTKPAPQ